VDLKEEFAGQWLEICHEVATTKDDGKVSDTSNKYCIERLDDTHTFQLAD